MKRKNGIAPFEAVCKSREKQAQEGLGVPGWFGSQAPQPAAKQPEPVKQAPQRPSAPTAPKAAGNEAPTSVLALTQKQLIMAGAGLVVLLVVVFVVAHSMGGRPTAPQQTGNDQPRGGGNAAVAKLDGVATGGAQLASPQRKEGMCYLAIQSTRSRVDADKINEWLKTQDVPATVEPFMFSGKPGWIVWSLKGFEVSQIEEGKKFALEIEDLGKKYEKQGGLYSFSQRNKNKELKPWYISFPLPKN